MTAEELLREFLDWSEEHPDIWEEHGEAGPGKHPRHIQCIAVEDLVWLEGYENRVRDLLGVQR